MTGGGPDKIDQIFEETAGELRGKCPASFRKLISKKRIKAGA